MRKTNIVTWTEEWEQLYHIEESILKEVLEENLCCIYHIGSTSIPTIGFAKPIIDILIVVKNINNIDLYHREMVTLGYTPKGENGIKGRRYFSKGKENRTHHLHIFQEGNENIKTHLIFKDYLINNPLQAKTYGDLKVKLQKQFPNEHDKYQQGKQQYVNELVNNAKEWALMRNLSY